MSITSSIKAAALSGLLELYQQEFTGQDLQINQNKTDFEGDYTVVLFALVKKLKLSPDVLGQALGNKLVAQYPDLFASFSIVKGFLNFTIHDKYWLDNMERNHADICYGKKPMNHQKVMVEYSSPNTNKPLHLGHLRNNFLGWSVAETLKANGYEVVKTCIVNDRGIHICKSMIAWQLFANGATPQSTGIKGDHFVGDYYVKFNDAYKAEVETMMQQGMEKAKAEKEAPIMLAAQKMLQDWEAGDPVIMGLWKQMNSWVYDGFDITYKHIGSDFEKTYYESNTYLLGKRTVEEGLKKKVFYQEPDSSVWIDLTADGLDKKIVQRSDGTSVYITQDIGLAQDKYNEYKIDKSIYVIGDEQNYHMKVLKLIAEKLELPKAEGIYHLSYGMVELPTGKMKSREGTVVDADDIVDEMERVAKEKTEELGKVKDFAADELQHLYHTIGLGALKFFLLKVDPKKRMIFNPEESIDFHGFTAPFIQFNYARIKSVLRKQEESGFKAGTSGSYNEGLLPLERELLVMLEQYPLILSQACEEMNPSVIAIYCYNLAKMFSSFYTEHSIASAESEEKKDLRLKLASFTANVIRSGMQLLGISVPERM